MAKPLKEWIALIGFGLIAGIILLSNMSDARASGVRYVAEEFNYYTTIEQGIDEDLLAEAVAKATACGASFNYSTHKFQGAVQGSYFASEAEICFEAAWRPRDTGILWNIAIVPDEEKDHILWRGGAQFEF